MINNTSSIAQTNSASQTSSVMPMTNKTVTIDGKSYPVIKVPDNNSGVSTFAQTYKEVVIIDGQQYDVETASDILGCDTTKEVVNVDGQQYDVNSSKLNFNLGGAFTFNEDARVNEDSTLCYYA